MIYALNSICPIVRSFIYLFTLGEALWAAKYKIFPDNFFFFNFIHLFLAVWGLRFCARAFSSCGERGPLFIAVCGPLTIAASLVAEHRLQTRRLSNCGSRAQLLHGMWDLPRPGIEPLSPALAGRFSTTAPPGKPPRQYFLRMLQLKSIRTLGFTGDWLLSQSLLWSFMVYSYIVQYDSH